ncbi:MAG: pyridoxal-phosphate dependent enzyme [Pirellulaceae bacterium]|nr:pyridoxal-phosphate dependent enzyme [Planctomycetaceae bacterium]
MFPVDVDPTLQDLLAALVNVYQHVKPMPLYRYSGLCDLVGTEIWVKHENHHGVGSFKVRGGINLVAELTAEERSDGLYTVSTGNHGQSIAYAAREFGAKATIAVAEQSNPGKVASIRGLGAEVVFHGADF